MAECIFARILSVAVLAFSSTAASAGLVTGDLLVSDVSPGGTGRLIEVNPFTGAQSIFSSGGFLQRPDGITFSADGNVIVTDRVGHAVIGVDRNTGAQTLITSGTLLSDPTGVVVAVNGEIVVVDTDAFGGPGGLIKVTSPSGTQAALSSGGNYVVAIGLAKENSGFYLVGDRGPQAVGGDGLIIRVDPTTGTQAILSQGGLLWNPDHLAVGPTGDIFVADHDGPNGNGGVYRIDPLTGGQTSISVNGFFAGGPSGIAVTTDGRIFVSDHNAIDGNGTIFRIDPNTGQQTTISSDGFFFDPYGVAVIPAPEPASLAIFCGAFAFVSIRSRRGAGR